MSGPEEIPQGNAPPLILELPFDAAVEKLIERVTLSGLTVMRTFDLQVARQAETACPCPHHGTGQCDCQMVVLLVYQANHHPVTLIAHGYNGRTWIMMVNTPQQRADSSVEATIQRSLSTPVQSKEEVGSVRVYPDQA